MEQTQKLKKAKEKPHYVDNKKFLQAMIEYRDKCNKAEEKGCLLYTSPSPRDRQKSRMPSSA